LYEEERVRFKQEPNLIQILNQRIDSTPEGAAFSRFKNRLTKEIGSGGLQPVEFPEAPADLPDTPDTPKLAVMHPETAAVEDGGSTPPSRVAQLYEQQAAKHDGETETRIYKNYALFLAPDADRMDAAVDESRRLEAIEALLDDPEQKADLSSEQIEELRERSDEAQLMLGELVRNVYRHLYYPDRDGLTHITIGATESNGGTTLVDAVQTTLEDKIVKRDAGARGSAHVQQKLWQQTQDAMSTEALANQYAKKPGLDYLFSTKPIRETVSSLVSDHGYAYWDGESGTAYSAGTTEPSTWPHPEPFAESPDVETSIRDSDVQIGSAFVVYRDIDALVDDHLDEIDRPEQTVATCAECRAEVENPEGSEPFYCEEHQSDTTCSSCGKEVASEQLLDEHGRCQECQPEESWEASKKMMSASRAFSEVRRDAESKAGTERTPLIEEVTIQVGGDDPFQAAKFVSQRPGFKAREDAVTVRMEYETRTDDGTYSAEFTGSPSRFRDVIDQPGSFGDDRETIQFRFQFDEPEPIIDEDDDLLAALDNDLDAGNIDVRIEGRGPIRASSEVTI
jgi:DNA-directed RNA polymerase subunit RPC12/RpoP